MLKCDIGTWWDANPTYTWEIDGLPLWNRSVGGKFTAKTLEEFVQAITVNSEWRLCYKLVDAVLHLNLAHHDVPTGRGYTVRYATDDEE